MDKKAIKRLGIQEYDQLIDCLAHFSIEKDDTSFKDIQNPKVALYCRVSTIEQSKFGYSLEVQEEELKEFCQKRGWVIYKIYIDKGKTATTTKNRKEYQKMLLDAEKGLFNIILFKWWSRLYRNQIQLGMMLPYLKSKRIFLYAMAESNDIISIKLKGVLDEEEIRRLKVRVASVMDSRAKAGKLVCRPAFGYSIKYKLRSGNKVGFVFPDENAEKVKEIFEYVSKLKSIDFKAISKRFDISSKIIKNMLSNRVYIGEIKYKGEWFKGNHKAIIKNLLFEKCQKVLEAKH